MSIFGFGLTRHWRCSCNKILVEFGWDGLGWDGLGWDGMRWGGMDWGWLDRLGLLVGGALVASVKGVRPL